MNFREEQDASKEYKISYLAGIRRLIAEREKAAEAVRNEHVKNIFSDQELYRAELEEMLGWPLTDHTDKGLAPVKAEKLFWEQGYTVYRMSFEVLDGLEMSGLYFEVNGEGKRPLVLVQHGGYGTPELISGFYENTENYNNMLERVVAQGVHAFAPQLLLWKQERYNVNFDRRELDAALKRVGSSITAVEVYGLKRILDHFEAQPNVSTFGMVGLSYGGFYTLFMAALDTRIRSAISCAYFNKRDKYPWSDWVWEGSAEKLGDAEIACLVYPRKLCIEIGKNDALFDVFFGEAELDRLKELCAEVGTEWLSFIKFEGTHEFCKDDEPIKRLVAQISREE